LPLRQAWVQPRYSQGARERLSFPQQKEERRREVPDRYPVEGFTGLKTGSVCVNGSLLACHRAFLPFKRVELVMASTLTFENMASHVGKELGVSGWHVVDQEKINQFAQCTGDHQWIHVDVERAKKQSPFGGTVAHGYLTLSLIAALSGETGAFPEPIAAAFNYGLDRVRFLTPVKAGAKVRLRIVLLEFGQKAPGQFLMKTQNTLEIEGEQKPAMIAEALAMLIPGKPVKTEAAA
jgi:acyl dehydratase